MRLHELFLSPDSSNADLALQLLTTMSSVEAFEQLIETYDMINNPFSKKMSNTVRFTTVFMNGRWYQALVIVVSIGRAIWIIHRDNSYSYVCFTQDCTPAWNETKPHLVVYTRWQLMGLSDYLTTYINYEQTI